MAKMKRVQFYLDPELFGLLIEQVDRAEKSPDLVARRLVRDVLDGSGVWFKLPPEEARKLQAILTGRETAKYRAIGVRTVSDLCRYLITSHLNK